AGPRVRVSVCADTRAHGVVVQRFGHDDYVDGLLSALVSRTVYRPGLARGGTPILADRRIHRHGRGRDRDLGRIRAVPGVALPGPCIICRAGERTIGDP